MKKYLLFAILVGVLCQIALSEEGGRRDLDHVSTILGGERSSREFPFVVRIAMDIDTVSNRCTGTLVKKGYDDVVITAKHCLCDTDQIRSKLFVSNLLRRSVHRATQASHTVRFFGRGNI